MPNDIIPRNSRGQTIQRSRSEIAHDTGQMTFDSFEQQFFAPAGIQWDDCSLTIPPDIPLNVYLSLTALALQNRVKSQWYAASLLDFGIQTFGLSATQAVEMAGVSDLIIGGLLELARVVPEARQVNLSDDHHRTVKNLPPAEQQKTLSLASLNGWNVEETRSIADRLQAGVAQQRPSARKVPVEKVSICGTKTDMTKEAISAIVKAKMSLEDIAWLVYDFHAFIRSPGNETLLTDDYEVGHSVYSPEPVTDLVPGQALAPALATEDAGNAPAAPSTKEQVLGLLGTSGDMTRKQIEHTLARIYGSSKDQVQKGIKALLDADAIRLTGRHDEHSASPTPSPYVGLTGKVRESQEDHGHVTEAEWQDAVAA